MDDFRGKKKTQKKRKELGKKRDKSDRKKAEIGSILYAGEGLGFKGLGSFRPFKVQGPLGPSKKKRKKHAKRKPNSQEDETKLLVPNAQYHKFRLAIIQIENVPCNSKK